MAKPRMITPIQLHLIRSTPLNSELKSQKFRKKLEKGVLFRGVENLENFEKKMEKGGGFHGVIFCLRI